MTFGHDLTEIGDRFIDTNSFYYDRLNEIINKSALDLSSIALHPCDTRFSHFTHRIKKALV